MNLLANLNLNRNELQYAVIHPLTAAPTSAKEGQVYYNSSNDTLYIYDGTNWKAVGVAYSQTSSTSAVITGLAADGTVTTTDVKDLLVSEGVKISDVAADAAQGITDAATAQEAAEAAQADVDALEETVAGLSSAVAGGLKFASVDALPDLSTMSDEDWGKITNGTIYLVTKNPAGTSPNLKDEYLYIKGDTKADSKFELIGDTAPSLEGYLKTEDLEGELEGLDISASTVSVAAPTEQNPTATEDVELSEVIADLKSDIATAQTAAETAQAAADGKKATDFIKTATATIAANATEATASFALEEGQTAVVMNVIEKDGNNVVYTDAEVTSTGVKFSIAEKYGNAITCTVFYYVV